ncbi:hypothetical protein V8C86DRAFT_1492342 [Haematococcus lacustris]
MTAGLVANVASLCPGGDLMRARYDSMPQRVQMAVSLSSSLMVALNCPAARVGDSVVLEPWRWTTVLPSCTASVTRVMEEWSFAAEDGPVDFRTAWGSLTQKARPLHRRGLLVVPDLLRTVLKLMGFAPLWVPPLRGEPHPRGGPVPVAGPTGFPQVLGALYYQDPSLEPTFGGWGEVWRGQAACLRLGREQFVAQAIGAGRGWQYTIPTAAIMWHCH